MAPLMILLIEPPMIFPISPETRRHERAIMADGRGKAPSKNKPSTGTSKDKRISGNGGAKPGPKPKK
jgi:hypothetical protein